MLARELGSIHELEKRFKEIYDKTPEGKQAIRDNWGMTPDAAAGMAAAEAMFGMAGDGQ